METLLTLMRNNYRDVDLLEVALRQLRVEAMDGSVRRICRKGGVEVILDAMMRCKGSKEVQKQGIR